MKRLETLIAMFTMTRSAAQATETRRQSADLVIGALLVVLAIGGFAL